MSISSCTDIIGSSRYSNCETIEIECMVSDLVSEIMAIFGDECIGSGYLLESEESLPDR
jgi:hypothetical protein